MALTLVGALALGGCTASRGPVRALPPLREQADVYVYLDPLHADERQVNIAIGGVALVAQGGNEVPLDVALPKVSRSEVRRQRLLASGRIPPGRYAGLRIAVTRATAEGEQGRSDLLVDTSPRLVAVPVVASSGGSILLHVSLDVAETLRGVGFTGSFSGSISQRTVPQLAALTTNTGSADVMLLDKRTGQVTATLPTGAAPEGLAYDDRAGRAYVALSDSGEVQVFDLANTAEVGRVRLRGGDRPREVALTPDGKVLVTINQRSRSVSFVDTATWLELARVDTRDEPSALLLDRSGRRAYVMNGPSNSLTVVDVVNRVVLSTIPTEARPLRAQLNAAGNRLYVVYGLSAYMTVYAVPEMTQLRRVFVGLGATTIKVDARTDLIYVARAGALDIYDPFSFVAVNAIDVPGAASSVVIDDADNTMLALVPARRAVVIVDLSARRVIAAADVGENPYAVAVAGERY